MSAWAKPGVKCVCVDTWSDDLPGRSPALLGPVSGQVYTIREIGVGLNPRYPDTISVRLVEIANKTARYRQGTFEASFGIHRFRPLITKSQEDDVALFRSLLDALPVGESA